MILESLKLWHLPTEDLLKGMNKALDMAIKKTLDETIGGWQLAAIYQQMGAIAHQFEVEQLDTEKGHFHLALQLERCKPKTMDKENLEARIKAEKITIAKKRGAERVKTYVYENDGQAQTHVSKLAGLDADSPTAIALKDKLDSRLKMLEKEARAALGDDPFDQEISVIAEVRAYYDVAASRFIDNICNFVDASLFLNLQSGMLSRLKEELGLDLNEDACKEACLRLLEDDEGRAKQRRDLLNKKAMLKAACDRLSSMKADMEDEL